MPSGHEEFTRFVILAVPRTGSNMLCTLLNSHPAILCHHELFNPCGIYYALHLRDGSFSLGTMEARNRDPLTFLECVWQQDMGYSSVGFKMTGYQNEVVVGKVLSDLGVKKILLRRRNRVKTFVSRLIAEKTGQWEVYRQSDLLRERPRVEVDLSALHSHIAANERFFAEIENYLRSTAQSPLQVNYENLYSQEEQSRIFNFLDISVDFSRSSSRLGFESVKQNATDLRELVANFEELKRMLYGTELAAELESLDY